MPSFILLLNGVELCLSDNGENLENFGLMLTVFGRSRFNLLLSHLNLNTVDFCTCVFSISVVKTQQI